MELQTEFNSNAEVLKRLNDYIKEANLYAEDEDLIRWYKCLEKIRRDVYVKMKHKKAKGKCVSDCIKCKCKVRFDKLYNEMRVFKNHTRQQNVAISFYKLLDDFQIFLMEFMELKGMLLKDDSSDMEIPDEW